METNAQVAAASRTDGVMACCATGLDATDIPA
jgi:hypothetical protein